MLFASSHSTIQSCTFNSSNPISPKSSSEINYINKNNQKCLLKSVSLAFVLMTHIARQPNSHPAKTQLAPQVSDLLRQTIPAPQINAMNLQPIPVQPIPHLKQHRHLRLTRLMQVHLSHPAHMFQHLNTSYQRSLTNHWLHHWPAKMQYWKRSGIVS